MAYAAIFILIYVCMCNHYIPGVLVVEAFLFFLCLMKIIRENRRITKSTMALVTKIRLISVLSGADDVPTPSTYYKYICMHIFNEMENC